MSQHDGVIDNGPGLAVRTDINAAVQALMTLNSGPVEPTTMYPGQLWLDTTIAPDGLLRQRNQANNAWVAVQAGVPANVISNIVTTVKTTSDIYTKPAGLKFLEVWLVGGGGGAALAQGTGAGASTASGGGGGGGGCYSLFTAAALAATEAYTVGAAGTGNGGASTFKGMTASGGTGSPSGTPTGTALGAAAAGVGGGASGGTLNIPGSQGGIGIRAAHGTATCAVPGEGGGSFFALALPTTLTTGGAVGPLTGIFPGGGARGAANGPSLGNTATAAGGAGCIILKEFY